MTLTKDDLSFLARFARSPDGRAFQLMLRARLLDADATLRKAQGEEILRAQGRAQTLAQLIDDIDSAQRKLEQHEQSPSQGKRPVLDRMSSPAPYQNLS